MYSVSRLTTWTFVTIATALSGCATYEKCGIEGCPADAKITANVESLLGQHSELNGIGVKTLDNTVYLTGYVNEGLQRETAESIARGAPQVANVVDSITVAR